MASYMENVTIIGRRKLSRLKQNGSLRDYVKEFTMIMQDIWEMSEKEKLNAFLDGLSQEGAREFE